MKYIMKAGTLYFNDIVSARIKGSFIGSEKKIYSANGSMLMHTDIANLEVPPNEAGNVRYRQYILFDSSGNKCAVANPDYAKGDDPTVVGWPLCRMPRVDHAKVVFDKNEYLLVMQNNQNYLLSDKSHKVSNPHFKWGFRFYPSGDYYWFRQRRDFAVPLFLVALLCRAHYFLPSSSLSFSSCS